MITPTSASVEAEEGTRSPILTENPRTECPRRERRGKSRPGLTPQDGTDVRGDSDSPAAEEPEANEGTSSSAQPPKKKHSLKPRMEREAELLNAMKALQGQVDVLNHDLVKAKRIPKRLCLLTLSRLHRTRVVRSAWTRSTQTPMPSTIMSTQRTVNSPR